MRMYQQVLITLAACALAACNQAEMSTQARTDQPTSADIQSLVSAVTAQTEALRAQAEEPAAVEQETEDGEVDVFDPAGDEQHRGMVRVSGDIRQCINVHFTDIPRGPDPRRPAVTSEVETEMDRLVASTIQTRCAPGYIGSLTERACSQNIEGLCLTATPRT